MNAGAGWLLATEHTYGVRVHAFDTYDDAAAAAEAATPGTEGSMVPNVDLDAVTAYVGPGFVYERGFFWLRNRYAVVLRRALVVIEGGEL